LSIQPRPPSASVTIRKDEYQSVYRHVGGDPALALAEFEQSGPSSWTSDLADIPAKYGLSDV